MFDMRCSLTIHGRAAHASTPHASIDPIVLASSLILRLQTIVSREVDPSHFAVLTIGAINAGDRESKLLLAILFFSLSPHLASELTKPNKTLSPLRQS
jgi:acetylornithine deacetylase/succinyl-diaminopimelate desuccinylase-like protein